MIWSNRSPANTSTTSCPTIRRCIGPTPAPGESAGHVRVHARSLHRSGSDGHHLHGAHTTADSDGYAESWWLPDASNLHGWASRGNGYTQYDRSNTTDGTAVFQYPNDQRAMACFFDDHSLGITRLNVYAGPISLWLIRGGPG